MPLWELHFWSHTTSWRVAGSAGEGVVASVAGRAELTAAASGEKIAQVAQDGERLKCGSLQESPLSWFMFFLLQVS